MYTCIKLNVLEKYKEYLDKLFFVINLSIK